jgi:hypothetical protein
MPVDEVKAIYHDNFGVKKAYAVVRHERQRIHLFSCSSPFSLPAPNTCKLLVCSAYPVDGVLVAAVVCPAGASEALPRDRHASRRAHGVGGGL